MSKLLSLQQVSYWYKQGSMQQYILKDVDMAFERGTFYTIVGPSGSGKTTFLALVSALDTPKEGMVLYEGTDLSKIGLTKFRNQYVSIVFQSYNLLPYMTAIQNVLTAMEITGVKQQNKKQYALDLLERVGISKDQANQKVLTLSGGQQQRVSIARAISSSADLIVADEPTGNLDEETAKSIITLLQKLAHDEGKCVIVVTHDQSIASDSDVKVTLTKGRMVEERMREAVVR
ncbi:ABC transporter ATP-binding protein [Sutcliffiella horikoshii]|uniref:ABC transporter ATP-binding protein n=1 Tax=Sutcliffiella horikoshii TaxID=79883 RepID=UPI001CBBC571|nr:ABC transporter ATP-binding protein [Sutcliffiella horikoshii]UAL49433.1 ABC transporter ATP-binding protein [Sutcliffiella horikoshii]